MCAERMLVQPAEADVDEISFSEAPAVAAHVRAEIEFRNFRANRALVLLLGVHFEFGFLGGYGVFTCGFGTHETRDGAEVSSGADDQLSFDLAVDEPVVSCSSDAR